MDTSELRIDTSILSDGDVVFQPRKVQRSGLWDAAGGRVLIYIHNISVNHMGDLVDLGPRA